MSTRLPPRKTLALVLTMAAIVAPILLELPFWLALMITLPFAWRGWMVHRDLPLPPRWLRLVLGAAFIAAIAMEFRTLIGRDGGVVLLAALAGLKLLETATMRDVRLVTLLGFFLTGTLFLSSQSMMTMAWVVGLTGWLSLQLFLWHQNYPDLRTEGRRAFRLVLEGLPIALLLFVLFPRLDAPLWRIQQNDGASTGISDVMTPGSFGRLTEDGSVAFRVDFDGQQPEKSALYWRGPVYELYDGHTWRQGPPATTAPPSITGQGPELRYAMTHEPQYRNWLFALDLPATLPADVRLTARLQAMTQAPITRRMRFTLSSHEQWQTASDPLTDAALRLPETGDPKARALAGGWRNLPDRVRVARALRFLSENEFIYSLAPPPLTSTSPVDEFLFSVRNGFCEHYASAFAFLMRAAGVPARVVGGYLGGEYNPSGNYWIIRQADAHAWVEVWLEGQGWQRVDPTAVIAPARINEGLEASVQDADNLPLSLRMEGRWLRNIRLQLDGVTHAWNQWVVGYDGTRQRSLLSRLGLDAPGSRSYVIAIIACVLLTLAIYLLLGYRLPVLRRTDPVQRAWLRIERKLKRQGHTRASQEPVGVFARRLQAAGAQQGDALIHLAERYDAARYGEDTTARAELIAAARVFR
ncbi:transglutaminase TgpA family protein [Chitinibacteraceae bacterium HSL-7]